MDHSSQSIRIHNIFEFQLDLERPRVPVEEEEEDGGSEKEQHEVGDRTRLGLVIRTRRARVIRHHSSRFQPW